METTIAPVDGYLISNRVLLRAPADEVRRHLTDPDAMRRWMVGVSEAKMFDATFRDGDQPGARIEMQGRVGKAASWICVGETLKSERHRLVREYLLTKAWAVSFSLQAQEPGEETDHPYRRRVDHRISPIDGVHTELETTVEVSIPGLPRSAVKPAKKAEQKALEASHRELERRLAGRRRRFAILSDSWHSPCFL